MEAGLGLDQGIVRVGQEFKVSHPDLSEEFMQINFEQRAGSPRIAAWKSFSDRADSENVRSFVAMLDPDRPVWNADFQVSGNFLRCFADSTTAKSGRDGGQDDHQAGSAVGVFHLPQYWDCYVYYPPSSL